jgi:hypothetical protein
MDMAEIDNQLLEQFFEPARQQQIEDKGFTEKVMRQLPDRAMRLSRCWTAFCIALGVILFIVFEGWQSLLLGLISLVRGFSISDIHPIPFFMVLGVLTSLALLEVVHRMDRMQV